MSFIYSIIAAIFMFLGTTSLNPTKYFLLFDSSNLLFFTVHAGRIVGIGLIVFIVTELILINQNKDRLPLSVLVLSAFGLTATSISNAVWMLIIYTTVIIAVGYVRKNEIIEH